MIKKSSTIKTNEKSEVVEKPNQLTVITQTSVDIKQSNVFSNSLCKELEQMAPNLLTSLDLISVMLLSNSFEKVEARGPFDWFNQKLGVAHFNKHFFKGCVSASQIGIQLRIKPTAENFSFLLCMNTITYNHREKILQLGQLKSGNDIPDLMSILSIISEYEWARKNKSNIEVDKLMNGFIKELGVKEMRKVFTILTNEVAKISQDVYGVFQLSLIDKNYLLLKIENYLNNI